MKRQTPSCLQLAESLTVVPSGGSPPSPRIAQRSPQWGTGRSSHPFQKILVLIPKGFLLRAFARGHRCAKRIDAGRNLLKRFGAGHLCKNAQGAVAAPKRHRRASFPPLTEGSPHRPCPSRGAKSRKRNQTRKTQRSCCMVFAKLCDTPRMDSAAPYFPHAHTCSNPRTTPL